ncbi:unnamed protein product [Prunus armeniaca]|uniref:Uncharacterized protein n=1 Tax=Prunus armeniaca TaxID=36596 RepID=A0A6J5XNP9_PRUAR|nr:unnamed protein product [Prunus armeniaca]
MEVLAHRLVGGFWSHCGSSEGVPMLCRPCFSDQKENARYVSEVFKIGIQLENELERAEIERGVRKLMVDEDGKGMRVSARELKEKIDVSMKGGSTYHSMKSACGAYKLKQQYQGDSMNSHNHSITNH